MSGTPRPAALDGAQADGVCAGGDSVRQGTVPGAAAAPWAALMDPELVQLRPGYVLLQPPGFTFLQVSSCVAPVSERPTLSAGVAVSPPRPTFLLDEPDDMEGSSHD